MQIYATNKTRTFCAMDDHVERSVDILAFVHTFLKSKDTDISFLMKMCGSATSLVYWYLQLKRGKKKTIENGICRFLSNVTFIDFFGLVFNR